MYYLNEERRVESLNLRNKIIEEVKKELNVDLGFWFNDLYKVKGGVVRRLKGGMYNGINLDDKEYNDLLDDVSDFILNLNWNRFRVNINKLKNYSWRDYVNFKNNGFEGNWDDYKKYRLEKVRVIILKIDWDF